MLKSMNASQKSNLKIKIKKNQRVTSPKNKEKSNKDKKQQ